MNNYIPDDFIMHYGRSKLDGAPGRGSGRYPYGSGKNPHQRSIDFLTRYQELKNKGLSDKDIAKEFYGEHGTTTMLRVDKSIATNEKRSALVAEARRLQAEGMSPTEIGRVLGKNESSVRSLLNDGAETRMNQAKVTADFLKDMVDDKGMIIVGKGAEKELGNISREKLNQALELLKLEGYEVYGRGMPQPTNPGQQTNLKILCPPGTPYADIYDNSKLHSIVDYEMENNKILTEDGTRVRPAFVYPESMDSKRLSIRYAEEGGENKDGVMEIRPGVEDLSLGNSHYAQVRILVDGDHYLKGMAMYGDPKDFPPGKDIIFNTNKKLGTPTEKVLKKIGDDPDNPFGALIKEYDKGGQSYYDDPKGKFIDPLTGKKQSLSLINKTREEGDWDDWANNVSAQFLSKQPKELAKKQLQLAIDDKKIEYQSILDVDNPTIRKRLLKSFSDDCDTAAVNLKAAAFPRQKFQVILPLTSIKDNEVYAPNFKDGEIVSLIRYPHAGTFEIPQLKVNNKNAEGNRVITKEAKDVIGINKHVADRLSGADFDGDTVLVIPTNSRVRIQSKSELNDLKGFDPKIAYGPDSTNIPYKRMSESYKQKQMGIVSNLITDMTIKGATDEEIARAVKHSMVVIDAPKHELDYRRSEKENGIAELRKKYSGRVEDGKWKESASTLISRSKGEISVTKRQGSGKVNQKGKSWYDPSRPEGALIFKTADDAITEDFVKVRKKDPSTGKYMKDKTGKFVYEINPKTGKPLYVSTGKMKVKTQKSKQMAEVDDARKLSSGHPIEEIYASYSNYMKNMANAARLEMVNTPRLEYKVSARNTYAKEVSSLKNKLDAAERNAPKEQMAITLANSAIEAKKKANPDLQKKEIKKISQQELTRAREKVGAKSVKVDIEDKEWEAIQAGAISDTMLSKILNHTDIDKLKERATPRANDLSANKQARIKSLKASGTYTNAEIAQALGISVSTVIKYS